MEGDPFFSSEAARRRRLDFSAMGEGLREAALLVLLRFSGLDSIGLGDRRRSRRGERLRERRRGNDRSSRPPPPPETKHILLSTIKQTLN